MCHECSAGWDLKPVTPPYLPPYSPPLLAALFLIEAFLLLRQLAPMLREFPLGLPNRLVLNAHF